MPGLRDLPGRWPICLPVFVFCAAILCLTPVQLLAQQGEDDPGPELAEEPEDPAAASTNAGDSQTGNGAAANAQPARQDDRQLMLQRLDTLAGLLQQRLAERAELAKSLKQTSPEQDPDAHARLARLTRGVERLQTTFEQLALGDLNVSLLDQADDEPFDWQRETVEIIEPLFDSLKALTQRPRQIVTLRESILLNKQKRKVAEEAAQTLEALIENGAGSQSLPQVQSLRSEWKSTVETLDQELLISQAQLDRLLAENQNSSLVNSVWDGVRSFLAGRGLTLVYVFIAGLLTWAVLRLAWWMINQRLSKQTRRHSTWYRVANYGFKLVTFAGVLVTSIAVLYMREDVLLMAVAFLVLAGLALSLKNILPRFVNEARLLLNLGPVREGEAVTWNDLPWQVMSINVHSVLRNPALEGIARLPLSAVGSLISRPLPDDSLWFPTSKGDCLLLPDGSFAKVFRQTPELVELDVRGGMRRTEPAAGFYSQPLINLSRSGLFGVGVTFGLDYSLQPLALTEIPDKLKARVEQSFAEAGYEEHLKDVICELKAAGNSSLDFLVWLTFDSQVAPDYFKLERVAQRACVAAANEQQWEIPFPNLMVQYREAT